MRLCQHVDRPSTHHAVGRATDDVVCVLGPDDVDRVHWVRVARSRQRSLLHRRCLGSGVPEKHLTAISSADDQVGMEGREFGDKDIRLGVEDVFRPIVKVQVPHLDQTLGELHRLQRWLVPRMTGSYLG